MAGNPREATTRHERSLRSPATQAVVCRSLAGAQLLVFAECRQVSAPRTVLFMPESAYGPTNNCIGIGNVLRERGHRVVFAAERSWAGKLEALGFEEDLVDLAPPPEPDPDGVEPDAGRLWTEFIR